MNGINTGGLLDLPYGFVMFAEVNGLDEPRCKNRTRSTMKCRRKCCRKPKPVVKESGVQVNLFGNRFYRTKNTGRIVEIGEDQDTLGPTFRHGRY